MHHDKECAERMSRRDVIVAAGVSLVGGAFATGCSSPQTGRPTERGGRGAPVEASARRQDGPAKEKPTYLPPEGTRDPAVYSLSENLFWTDILSEHGLFFSMLMPGDELAKQREEAKRFQTTFANRLERAKTTQLQRGDYVAFNRETAEMVKPFVEWKRRMQGEQESGKLKSLVWPTFFEHTAHEAERFVKRLEQLNGGSVALDRAEAIPFWAGIMGEHADFIAHLLDPAEKKLVDQALETARTFYKVRDDHGHRHEGIEDAAHGILDFKTAAEKGINAGKVKSIIHPALAAHVRREAAKFVDELKRLQSA